MPDPPIFVGRQQELQELQDAIAQSEGQLVLLVGEVGRGKTAILEELHRLCAHDAGRISLLYQLNESDTSELFLLRLMGDLLNIGGITRGKPLWTAPGQVEKLKGFLTAIGKLPSLPGLEAIETLAELLKLLLRNDRRPARERFLDFLRYAAHRLQENERLILMLDPDKYLDLSVATDWGTLARDMPARTTMIFAQRPEDCLAKSEVLAISPKTKCIPESPLSHLTRAESERLISRVWHEREGWKRLSETPPPELSDMFWERYQGWALPLSIALQDIEPHPASLDKLLRAAKKMPPGLQKLLRLRYHAAVAEGPNTVKLLQCLAVLGRPVSCARLATLYGTEGSDQAALFAAAALPHTTKCLAASDGGVVSFFHETMLEYVYSDLDVTTRRDLHRRAAALYQQDLDANKSDAVALDALPVHLHEFGDTEAFLSAVSRLGPEKYRLRLLRS